MGASGGVDSQCSNWNRIRRTDLIHHRINHKALETLAMATTPATTAVHQVNLPFSYYHRSKGTSLPRRRRGANVHTRRVRFVHSPNWKKHKLCLCFPYHYNHIVATGRNDDTTKPTVYYTDDNGTPATWTLVLFQQAIDRQDRTPAEGRFSSWNHWRHSLHRNSPTTGQGLVARRHAL